MVILPVMAVVQVLEEQDMVLVLVLPKPLAVGRVFPFLGHLLQLEHQVQTQEDGLLVVVAVLVNGVH